MATSAIIPDSRLFLSIICFNNSEVLKQKKAAIKAAFFFRENTIAYSIIVISSIKLSASPILSTTNKI